MSVSPESVHLPALPPAPSAPSPVPVSAAAAADPGPSDAALSGKAGAADSQQTAKGGKPGATAAPSTDRKAGPARSAAPKSAGSGTSAAHPSSRNVPAGGEFSRALARSLAAHAPAGAVADGAPRGKPAGKPGAAHAPSRHGKTDPVTSALALVAQGLPAAPAQPDAKAAGAADAAASSAAAGHRAVPALKALLTHAADQNAQAQAASSTAANAAPAHAPAQTPASNGAAPLVPGYNPARAGAVTNPGAALSTAVGSDAWPQELGSKLTWMTQQGIQSASLQLSPEHLGPLQVSIAVHHGQASVWFGAEHAETRQALERAMPQLRQMLSNQGLTLTDSGVSRDSPRERAPQQGTANRIGAEAGASAEAAADIARARVGLVDAYA